LGRRWILDINKKYNQIVEEAINYLRTGFREQTGFKKQADTYPPKKAAAKEEQLDKINNEILSCTTCPLHLSRINAVPGKGAVNADIIFIGEGPGEMEDIKGEPFVGRAGELLTKMLAAINLKREEVYITNIVKCRPPNNRTPLPEEVDRCFPYLDKQIDLIDPLIICSLGGPAAHALLGTNTVISKLRGTIHQYKDTPLIPTFHPAAVLRFPEKYKRHVWNDLKLLRDYYKDIKK